MTDKKPKIAILHDAFLYRGGGERLVTLMAKALHADLVSGFFSSGSFDPRELGFTGKMLPLGKPVFAKGLRHMILKWRFFWKASILRDYDIVIFSGDCLGAMRHVRKSRTVGQNNSITEREQSDISKTVKLGNCKTIYYCHTPPRYLYDFRDQYLANLSWYIRPIFRLVFWFFAHLYESHLSGFDHIISNSQNVQKRLLDFTGVQSEIIYPPTDTTFFTPREPVLPVDIPFAVGGYFYSWARLSPPKRVGMIIDVFLQMPKKNLVFSYGKNDPLKDEILAKIKDAKNIIAIEAPRDNELLSLIRGAIATIYIPVDEDFGMSPIESMACGTPVIGVDEGGLRETIIQDKTGKLIQIESPEGGIQNLKKVIQDTTKEEWESMKNDCINRSKDFSLEKFQEKLKSSLQLKL